MSPSWWSSGPKKPPPAHGLKIKKAGTTWWGQLWIAALVDVLGVDAGRLSRGRTYARAGRVHDLVIAGGGVTAKVTGSRPRPYDITIKLTQLSKAEWRDAIERMAERAQFAAELLAGQMPKEIAEAFSACDGLFPAAVSDLDTDCSCPDWGDPCKHVAATHHVLGETLDRDPFLLFELRGRTKAQVLDALRAARGGASEVVEAVSEVAHVSLKAVAAADYDRARAPLPSLHLSFDAPATHGAVLRQLGTPAAWRGEASPDEVLTPLVRAAAERARALAMAEPAVVVVDEPPTAKKVRKARAAKPAATKAKPKPAKPKRR